MTTRSSRRAGARHVDACCAFRQEQTGLAPADSWPVRALYFGPAGLCVLATLCLAVVALGRCSVSLGLVSLLLAAGSAGLGYQAAVKTLAAVRHEGKEGVQYTTARARRGNVDMGLCEVTIPKSHSIGELEAPSILRLEVHEDLARHEHPRDRRGCCQQ